MSPYQHFDVRRRGELVELELADTSLYDVTSYAELQEELMRFMEEHSPRRLIVNFNQVQYCSTALINGVLRGRAQLTSQGGDLKLCEMSEPVRDTFRRLSLDGDVFQIYERDSDAVSAF